MTEDYMCPNCITPWKCNGPHIPESVGMSDYLKDNPNTEILYVALVFDPSLFHGKYNKGYREQLAQDAYDTVFTQLDERYPDPFEDMREN